MRCAMHAQFCPKCATIWGVQAYYNNLHYRHKWRDFREPMIQNIQFLTASCSPLNHRTAALPPAARKCWRPWAVLALAAAALVQSSRARSLISVDPTRATDTSVRDVGCEAQDGRTVSVPAVMHGAHPIRSGVPRRHTRGSYAPVCIKRRGRVEKRGMRMPG
jgi:hypothetical protein